jgi:hypothetical protein
LWPKGCAYLLGKPEKRHVKVVLAFGRHFVVICIDLSVEINVFGFDLTLPYAIDLGAERLGGRGRGGGRGKRVTLLPQITMGMRLPAGRRGESGGWDVNGTEGMREQNKKRKVQFEKW